MSGYPVELRDRIVRARFEFGKSISEIAVLFGVSERSVGRYITKF